MKLFAVQANRENLVSVDNMALIDAVGYYKFLYGHREDMGTYNYFLVKDVSDLCRNRVSDIIPIGDLNYVRQFMQMYYNVDKMAPINVPLELWNKKYLKRNLFEYTGNEGLGDKVVFVKSAERLKGIAETMRYSEVSQLNEKVIISDVIENIISEWRAFVHRGQLVGLNNYLGDFTVFPDVVIIKEMINVYKNCPLSYTLDVAVCEHGTVIIEVHNFVSCGLYGFNEHKLLPLMAINGWKYLLHQNGITI